MVRKHLAPNPIDTLFNPLFYFSIYRVFYYDYPSIKKQVYHPLHKKAIDLGKTDDYMWANEFFKELKHQRKFALRLGRLSEDQAFFNIKPDSFRKLINGSLKMEDFSLIQKTS